MVRTFLAIIVVGGSAYLSPWRWELLLGIFFFGLFALLALLAFFYRDPHRRFDATDGAETE